MGERVVLDGAGVVAQRLELGQRVDGRLPLGDEARLDVLQRLLEHGVVECLTGVRLEGGRGDVHQVLSASPIAGASAMPASTSATWRAFTALP